MRLLPAVALALAVAASAPEPGTAQGAGPEAESGFLERQIQNLLGGEGRDVRVIGLSGVLSSEATIERIEIADDDGTWLVVRDVALDWRRLALLRGRLEVDALTVGVIDLARLPAPGPAEPPALASDEGAAPFALPELPVAVEVAQLSIGAVRLGAPVIGYEAALSLNGAARLAGGAGTIDMSVVRIDGHDSRYGLRAGYDNATTQVLVDLDVIEAADGLVTTLAGIPGAPPLTLTVAGDAPLGDFTADLALRTDDTDRLVGQVTITDQPVADGAAPVRRIAADVAGDVAELFLPDYQDFFGRRVALELDALQGAELGLDVETLSLQARGLDLRGSARLNTAYLPEVLDLTARIGTESGLPVVVPVAGPGLLVHGADVVIAYDEAAGDSFDVDIRADGVMRADGLLIDRLALDTDGTLTKTAPTEIASVSANVAAELTGFSTTDPALWEAVGDAITLSAIVDWENGGALTVSDFDAATGDVTATGRVVVTGLQDGEIAVDADVAASADDLGRFSAISGQDLAGALQAQVAAVYDVVSGAFDAALAGEARDLEIGLADADGLLTGLVQLDVAAARDADGIRLDRLTLDGERIDLTGSAALAPDGFPRAVNLTGRVGAATGPAVVLPVPDQLVSIQTAEIDVAYDAARGEDFRLMLDLREAVQAGTVSVGAARLTADGQLTPDPAGVAGIGRIAAAVAADVGTILLFDPALNAALSPGAELRADLDWQAAAGTARLGNLSLRSGGARLDGSADVAGLDTGAIAATGRIDLATGPLARFAELAGLDLRGAASARGDVAYATETGFFDVALDAEADEVGIGISEVDRLLRGRSTVTLRAVNDADGLRIDRAVVDTAELDLTATSRTDGARTLIDLDGGLRDLGLFVAGFNGPLTLAGTASGAGSDWTVDAGVTGPAGSAIDVQGDIAADTRLLDLRATGQLPLGLANPFIRPRTLDGMARLDVAVAGPPALESVSGTVTVAGARAADPATRLALEQIGLTVQLARSRAQIDLDSALSTGGRITVAGPVTLSGDFPAAIDVRLINLQLVDPTLYEIGLSGQIGVNGPLLGGADIAGRIDIGRSEIKVPASLGGGGTLIDVEHRGASSDVRQTLRRAGLEPQPAAEAGAGGGRGGPEYGLDLLISAPRAIFIRGRGLDVEMGGAIEIGGTTSRPLTTGEFSLIRGRLNLLARRLDFDTATISLQGDLEPDLLMVASSDSGDIVAQIVIEGPLTEPELRFTSDPELPEDEVLAQLFFGKPLQDLTPLEVGQLVAAINRLTGGGGTGPLGFAREALGIDNLSVASDEDGTASVTAGRYLTERVYTDVTVAGDGTSEVQLNFEVSDSWRLRGSFDNEGDSGVGVFFQRDY